MKILFLLVAVGGVHAQELTFDVASIKPGPPPVKSVAVTGARLFRSNSTLAELISWAYHTEDYRTDGLPAWVDSQYYVIVANSEGVGALSNAEFQQMLRALLAERFGVKVHSETREVSVYALLVDKNGPKFHESVAAGTRSETRAAGRLEARNYEMSRLAPRLSEELNRKVLDLTGLTGRYDLTVEWSPDDTRGPSIFAAVKEQLGLRLEARKVALDVLIVDQVEKPDVN